MRYLSFYEEFRHDEVYDVMMSICDTVSFSESDKYPSTDRLRVYETSESVEFDASQYEEYLDGWSITGSDCLVVFVRGDLRGAAISWLNEVYGGLRPDQNDEKQYADEHGVLFVHKYQAQWDRYSVYVSYGRIWSLLEYLYTDEKDIRKLVRWWLAKTYGLTDLQKIDWYVPGMG